MEPDDLDDEPVGPARFSGPPLPLEDRLWRHPSEIGHVSTPAAARAPGAGDAAGDHEQANTAALTTSDMTEPAQHATSTNGASRGRRARALVGVGAACAVGGALVATVAFVLVGPVRDRVVERTAVERHAVVPAVTGTQLSTTPTPSGPPRALVDAVRPAVVRVEALSAAAEAVGTGVMYRSDGYLFTAAHVVSGAKTVSVVLADGTVLTGKVVGADLTTDVAVVKVTSSKLLPTAVLGSALSLSEGDALVGIGAPAHGTMEVAAHLGSVTATGRYVRTEAGKQVGDLIQTDFPFGVDAVGGPLVDSDGNVVGIATALSVSGGVDQLGFATPIEVAKSVADSLLKHGQVLRAWIGIHGVDVPDSGGAQVQDVIDKGPAAVAGLQPGDVIVHVDGLEIDRMSDLSIRLRAYEPGAVVNIGVLRDGMTEQFSVALTERPDDAD